MNWMRETLTDTNMSGQPAAWRQADRSFAVTVLPPVQAEGSVQATMQRVMDIIGRQIEAHPEHWYMFRRMWPVGPAKLPARLEEAVA